MGCVALQTIEGLLLRNALVRVWQIQILRHCRCRRCIGGNFWDCKGKRSLALSSCLQTAARFAERTVHATALQQRTCTIAPLARCCGCCCGAAASCRLQRALGVASSKRRRRSHNRSAGVASCKRLGPTQTQWESVRVTHSLALSRKEAREGEPELEEAAEALRERAQVQWQILG